MKIRIKQKTLFITAVNNVEIAPIPKELSFVFTAVSKIKTFIFE